MAALLQSHGAKVANSVSKRISAVLAGDKPGASKLRKAQQLGVPVLPMQQFLLDKGLA
jgi:DNA ligase (NAD+)